MEEKTGGEVAAVETVEVDTKVTELEVKLAKMTEERDNYKTGLLQQKGKLQSDGFNNEDVSDMSVSEQVKLALMEEKISEARMVKEEEMKRILRENSELKLALKNRPEGSIGSGAGSNAVEVKDNVFSNDQVEVLKQKAIRLKVDPDKFVANAKKNLSAHNYKL